MFSTLHNHKLRDVFYFGTCIIIFTDILAGFTFNNRVLRLPAIVLLNTTFRPGNFFGYTSKLSNRPIYTFKLLGQLGIRTAMRSSKIKWSIMKGVKDKQKEEEIPGVVYAIGCGDCRKVYVGETRRTAAQRVKEHKSDTRLGHLDKLAVAEHAHTTGHHIHWKAMVVEREHCAKLAAKPIHFDLTGARPANRSSSGFGHLHRNLSHTKSMAFSKWLSFAFGNRYFLMWTYFAFDGFCFVLPLSFEKKKKKKKELNIGRSGN